MKNAIRVTSHEGDDRYDLLCKKNGCEFYLTYVNKNKEHELACIEMLLHAAKKRNVVDFLVLPKLLDGDTYLDLPQIFFGALKNEEHK